MGQDKDRISPFRRYVTHAPGVMKPYIRRSEFEVLAGRFTVLKLLRLFVGPCLQKRAAVGLADLDQCHGLAHRVACEQGPRTLGQ